MNIRLVSIIGLTINYTGVIIVGFILGHVMNYFLNGTANIPLLLVTIVIINTVFLSHMRNYWKDLILGARTEYLTHRPGFTNEILEPVKSKGRADDLIELLQQATKKESRDNSDLKGNPLDD